VETAEPRTLRDHWLNLLAEFAVVKVRLFQLESRKPEPGELNRLKGQVEHLNRYVELLDTAWQMERSYRAEGKAWK
jgi:hypothetical protein